MVRYNTIFVEGFDLLDPVAPRPRATLGAAG